MCSREGISACDPQLGSPEKQWGIPFDAPLFYWYREEDKERQLITYMEQTFSIQPSETKKAVLAGMMRCGSLGAA